MRVIWWTGLIAIVCVAGCAARRGTSGSFTITEVEVLEAFASSPGVSRVVDALAARGCTFAFEDAPLAFVREGDAEAGLVLTRVRCEADATATLIGVARTVEGSPDLEAGLAAVFSARRTEGGRDRTLLTFDEAGALAEVPVTTEVRASLDAWVAANVPVEPPAEEGLASASLCSGGSFCGSSLRATANACAHALGHEIPSGPFDCCQCMSDVDQCVNFVADITENALGCERTLICAGQRAGLSAESVVRAFDDGDPATPASPMPTAAAGGTAGREWDWASYPPCATFDVSDASRDYCQAAFDGFDVRAYGQAEGGEDLEQFLEGVEVAGGVVSIAFPPAAAAWGGISAFVIAPLNAAIGAGALDTDNYRRLGDGLSDRWLGPGPGAQDYCWGLSLEGDNYQCNRPACMALPTPGVYFDPVYTLNCTRTPTDTTGDGTPDCSGTTRLWEYYDVADALESQVGFAPGNDDLGVSRWDFCCESDLEYRILDRPRDVIYGGIPEAPRPLTCVYYAQDGIARGGGMSPLADQSDTSFDDRECTWAPSSLTVTGSAVLSVTDS